MNSPEPAETLPTLDDLDAGIKVVAGISRPDAQDLLERQAVERGQLQIKLARSHIKNVKADRSMRKTYAGRILRYLEFYSIVVGVLVVIAGWRVGGFSLPVPILAALVGSTAVAAIGLVGFIARGLFRLPPSERG